MRLMRKGENMEEKKKKLVFICMAITMFALTLVAILAPIFLKPEPYMNMVTSHWSGIVLGVLMTCGWGCVVALFKEVKS